MNKNLLFAITFLFVTSFILISPNLNHAKEILIYADSISYDEDNNIIARGNAKVIYDLRWHQTEWK